MTWFFHLTICFSNRLNRDLERQYDQHESHLILKWFWDLFKQKSRIQNSNVQRKIYGKNMNVMLDATLTCKHHTKIMVCNALNPLERWRSSLLILYKTLIDKICTTHFPTCIYAANSHLDQNIIATCCKRNRIHRKQSYLRRIWDYCGLNQRLTHKKMHDRHLMRQACAYDECSHLKHNYIFLHIPTYSSFLKIVKDASDTVSIKKASFHFREYELDMLDTPIRVAK